MDRHRDNGGPAGRSAIDQDSVLDSHRYNRAEPIMKLSDKQRQELFDALRERYHGRIKELDEIVVDDIDRIDPVVARWLSEPSQRESVLEKALRDLLDDPYWQKRIACVESGFGTATEYGQVVLRALEALGNQS